MSDIEYNDFSDSNSDGESLNEYKKTQPFKKRLIRLINIYELHGVRIDFHYSHYHHN